MELGRLRVLGGARSVYRSLHLSRLYFCSLPNDYQDLKETLLAFKDCYNAIDAIVINNASEQTSTKVPRFIVCIIILIKVPID